MVNLSALQLQHSNFTALTAHALKHADIAPPPLELELTESLIMNDMVRRFCQNCSRQQHLRMAACTHFNDNNFLEELSHHDSVTMNLFSSLYIGTDSK
ncbi:hypothetical protein [Massilia niabensis]|uniref:Uncharacterized protein n=1 Tax=Massilia niabensis TaxID=544910 RepID=A0ABW0L9T6_9BURK